MENITMNSVKTTRNRRVKQPLSAQELKLQGFAEELAKDLKNEEDLQDLTAKLLKMTIESALKAEMSHHLGYESSDIEGHHSGNNRNGYGSKKLKSDYGEVEINTPRDRDSSFEPKLVKKHQRKLKGVESKIISLYAKGMSTRDIVETFKELYDVEVSAGFISQVTNAVIEEVIAWQNRPLEGLYPIVYLDCLVLKIRQDAQVINKAMYIALGINKQGHKEVLGLWLSTNEGSKFWLNVLTELNNRGVEQILIACVDGLNGFAEAINTVYPDAKVQLCIVHMIRNSLKYVGYKHYKEVTKDLKKIYQAITEAEAQIQLEKFANKWQDKYPQIAKSWHKNWDKIIPFFAYPTEIRKAIYTTNAIESLNSVIRKYIKSHKIFPTDEAALKVVYLAIQNAAKKWTMPIRDWNSAMSRFIIEFDEKIEHLI